MPGNNVLIWLDKPYIIRENGTIPITISIKPLLALLCAINNTKTKVDSSGFFNYNLCSYFLLGNEGFRGSCFTHWFFIQSILLWYSTHQHCYTLEYKRVSTSISTSASSPGTCTPHHQYTVGNHCPYSRWAWCCRVSRVAILSRTSRTQQNKSTCYTASTQPYPCRFG